MIWKVLRRSVLQGMGVLAALGLAGSASASSTGASDAASTTQTANESASFSVTIDDTTIEEWVRVSIPASRSVEPEGTGEDERVYQLVSEYDDLEMERRLQPGDDLLWAWRDSALQAEETGELGIANRSVTVTLRDDQNQPRVEWEFTDAWVKEYDTLELEGGDYGETAVESVTVRFDEVTRRQL